MAMANVSGFASCTSSSFSRSVGYILRGFLLGEFEVGDIMECKKRCIISVNCLSHGSGEYYGLKVSIRMNFVL